jgi:hypothetical protein
MNIKELQQERTDIFHDVFDGKIPKRVPIEVFFGLEVIAQRSNLNLIDVQWNPSLLEEAVDQMCQDFFSDICPYKGALRWPAFYQILKSQSFVMGSTGYFQHPEVSGMAPEDYDEFINNPFDCMMERILPRLYKGFDFSDPLRTAMNLAKGILAFSDDFISAGIIMGKMIEKYGYYAGAPAGSDGGSPVPFDFIADQLRGFKGISTDIRRIPEKILLACEAIFPLTVTAGSPAVVSPYGHVGMPLHMPSFMKEKDFEKFYWPTFKQLLDDYASRGIHCYIFCEDDWMRYLDYLYELPTNTYIQFEYGDPQIIKEKLGKKHIISGLYPLTYLKSHSKQECLDKAKELVDILAPGGKYIFNFDKGAMSINDINLENCNAVTEFVRDYTIYKNQGEPAGLEFHKEDYKALPHKSFSTKYLQKSEDQKTDYNNVTDFAVQKLQGYEDRVFNFLRYLLS